MVKIQKQFIIMKNTIKILSISTLLWVFGGMGLAFSQTTNISPDYFQVPILAANPVCTLAERGRLYYNSTNNCLYFCNGFKLMSVNYKLLQGANLASSGTILTISNNGAGKSLVTDGRVNITDIGNSAGRVLKSDASGNATFQDLGSPVSFRVSRSISGSIVPNNSFTNLFSDGITTENFDLGDNFVSVNPTFGHAFKCPQNGIYHFDVSVKWAAQSNAVNDVETHLEKCNSVGTGCVAVAKDKIKNQYSPNQTFGINLNLLQDEYIRVRIIQTGNGNLSRDIEGGAELTTYFSGHLVR
jgi:hypothetical protein